MVPILCCDVASYIDTATTVTDTFVQNCQIHILQILFRDDITNAKERRMSGCLPNRTHQHVQTPFVRSSSKVTCSPGDGTRSYSDDVGDQDIPGCERLRST